MYTDGLWVLQDGLRLSRDEIENMARFVAGNGCFNEEAIFAHQRSFDKANLIVLVSTPDGRLYIRDGLHRVCVINRFNRPLREDEYVIEAKTYEQFQQINFDCGWVTPFDPHTHVRHAEFFDFKNKVMGMLKSFHNEEFQPQFYEMLTYYIQSHVHEYRVIRNVDVRYVGAFAAKYINYPLFNCK
jgi:hypothetical protein